MKYKLICIDIDGTLIDDTKKIPKQVKESLREVYKMGIAVALVTGRAPAGADIIERELEFPSIKACNAGTYILQKEQCIYTNELPSGMAKYIYENFASKYQVPLWIVQGRDWYVTSIDDYIKREIALIQQRPILADMEVLTQNWEKTHTGPNKLLIAAEAKVLRKMQSEIKALALSEIDVARSSEFYLEIFPKGANKGEALAAICQKLEISLEETMAFGDQELDIPMIEKAGMGIAVDNAIEELKKVADFVTKSNNEAGIAYALKRYLHI